MSVIIVIFLTLSVFYWFRGKAIDNLNKNNELILRNTNVVFLNSIETVQNLALELFQNVSVRKTMFQKQFKLDDSNMNLVTQIRNILTVNKYINSVHILNDSDTVLQLSKLFTDDESGKQLFDLVSKSKVSTSPLFWTMKSRYAGNKEIKTMTVFYHEGVIKDNYFGGAVVVNIDMDVLEKNIFSEQKNSKENLFVIDNTGKIVLHNNMDKYGLDVSSEPYIRKIFDSKELNSNFNMDIDGRNISFSYIRSSNGKFYLISQMENLYSIGDLIKASNIILIVDIIIFLFAIFISALIAYRLYKPFENIVRNIKNMFGDLQVNSSLNEVQFLSNTFTNMVDKLNTLEKENESNTIVKALLSHDREGANTLGELLQNGGILSQKTVSFLLAVVKIDGYKKLIEENSPETVSFMVSSMSTIAREFISQSAKCYSYQIANDEIVLITSGSNMDMNPLNMDVLALMEKTRDKISELVKISVTIGMSSVSKDINTVHEKFAEAKNCLDYRIFFDKGSVIAFDKISGLKSAEIPAANADKVIDSVKGGLLEEFEISLVEGIEICRSVTYDKSVKFLTTVAVSMIELSRDILSEDNKLQNTNYLEIYNTITGFDDDEDLKKWFKDLFLKINNIMNDRNSKKIQNVLIDIIEYIHQNYFDPQLSSSFLADKLSITSQYFSKIFNDFAGCSLPDYINRIRLEKAKELLLSDLKLDIHVIAEKVGFRSNTYFTTAFKKKYGITPSKLRLNSITK